MESSRCEASQAATFGVLLAQRLVQIKEDLIAQSRRHQTPVEKRLQAGDASRFETLRADVQVANLQPELVRATNALRLGEERLKNVLGLQQSDTLAVSGTIEYRPETVDTAAAVRRAREQRPEVVISRLSRELTEQSRRIQSSLPSLLTFA